MLPDRTKLEKIYKTYFPASRVWNLSSEVLLQNLRTIDIEVSPKGDIIPLKRVTSVETPLVDLKEWFTYNPDLDRTILSYIDDPRVLLAAIQVNKYAAEISGVPWFWLSALRNRYGEFRSKEDPKRIWLRVEFSPVPFYQISFRREKLEHTSTEVTRSPNQEGLRTDLTRIILLRGHSDGQFLQEALSHTTSPHQVLSAFISGLIEFSDTKILIDLLNRTFELAKEAYHDLLDFMEETQYSGDYLVEALYLQVLPLGPPEVLDELVSRRTSPITEEDLEIILLKNPHVSSFEYALKFFNLRSRFSIFWRLSSHTLRHNQTSVKKLLIALNGHYQGSTLFSDDHVTLLSRVFRINKGEASSFARGCLAYPEAIIAQVMRS